MENWLNELIPGSTAPSKVPAATSKSLRASSNVTSGCEIRAFHSFAGTCIPTPLRGSPLGSRKVTISFLTFTFNRLKGASDVSESLRVNGCNRLSPVMSFRNCSTTEREMPATVPLTPSGEIKTVPTIFKFAPKSSRGARKDAQSGREANR